MVSSEVRTLLVGVGFSIAFVGVMATFYIANLDDEAESKIFWTCVWIIPWNISFFVFAQWRADHVTKRLFEENSRNIPMRDAVRNSWTNTALISALFCTIAAAAWMLDRPEPGELADWKVEVTNWKIQAFGLLCANSLFFSMLASVLPILYLLFTDGLSEGAFQYFLHNTDGDIGAYPLLYLAHSLACLWAALCVRSAVIYGNTNALLCGMTGTLGILIVGFNWVDLTRFKNAVDVSQKMKELVTLAKSLRKTQDMIKVRHDYEHWEEKEVAAYIQKEFPQYATDFEQNKITGEEIDAIEENHLQQLGVSEVGTRLRMMRYLKNHKLLDEFSDQAKEYGFMHVTTSMAQHGAQESSALYEEWDPKQVAAYINKEYPQYAVQFEEHEITGAIMVQLQDADLEKLGVGKIGHRVNMLSYLKNYERLQEFAKEGAPPLDLKEPRPEKAARQSKPSRSKKSTTTTRRSSSLSEAAT